jgi:hypothetical protein
MATERTIARIVFFSIILLFYRIITARMKGMTTENPLHPKVQTPEKSVFFNCFVGIDRA